MSIIQEREREERRGEKEKINNNTVFWSFSKFELNFN